MYKTLNIAFVGRLHTVLKKHYIKFNSTQFCLFSNGSAWKTVHLKKYRFSSEQHPWCDYKATSHRPPIPSRWTQSLSSHCPMWIPPLELIGSINWINLTKYNIFSSVWTKTTCITLILMKKLGLLASNGLCESIMSQAQGQRSKDTKIMIGAHRYITGNSMLNLEIVVQMPWMQQVKKQCQGQGHNF